MPIGGLPELVLDASALSGRPGGRHDEARRIIADAARQSQPESKVRQEDRPPD
jgi:hypothetical protein